MAFAVTDYIIFIIVTEMRECLDLLVVNKMTFSAGISFGSSILRIYCGGLSGQPAWCGQVSLVTS